MRNLTDFTTRDFQSRVDDQKEKSLICDYDFTWICETSTKFNTNAQGP